MEIKRYLSRRGHQGLDYGGTATTGQRKKIQIIRLRGPRRDPRVGTSPKLRWMITPPLKLVMTKVKSVYMNFMLKLAGNVGGALNTDNKFGVKRTPKAPQLSSKSCSGDAFEARLVFEISKNLVASHELHSM